MAPHGENAQKFVYMVEAGMPPVKVIRGATVGAAKLIGVEEDLGSVEAGKYAGLVAVPGGVFADIDRVRQVSFVRKGGVVSRQ